VNENVALREAVVAGGPERIVVSGGSASGMSSAPAGVPPKRHTRATSVEVERTRKDGMGAATSWAV
jgi:hypothetical protein